MTQTTIIEIEQKLLVEKINYEQFLQQYNDTHAEWIEGEVTVLMTASAKHQDISDWLTAILRFFVEHYNLGWVCSAPFNMYMPHLKRGREPDIIYVADERLHIVQSSNLSDAADLVIEIVSPESAERDRVEKFAEYEAAGVREYWLIDPTRQQAEFYHLLETERYSLISVDDGIFRSTVLPGFWLEVDWLWQEQLPKLLTTMQAFGLL